MKTHSQNRTIRQHLESGESITTMQAIRNFRITRLAARINDLRNDGMYIITETIKRKGTRFAKYSLGGNAQ